MRKTWAVAVKEMRQIARDPLSLLLLLGLPAFFIVLYGFALNFDVRHVALGVQDRDGSAASRELVAAFVNSTYFDVVATPGAGEDLARLTERRLARGILVIPEGYGADLSRGEIARVQLLLDGADANTATTALGYARNILAEADTARLRATLVALGEEDPVAGIVVDPRVLYNPELSSTRFLLPGLFGSLLMLTSVLSTAMSVAREKERGTMEQIRVAPIRTAELILGKTLPYLGISFAAAALLLVTARVVFGVEVRGSYADLLVVTLLYLLGALGFGLLLSTAADSQATAFQMALLTSNLPSILLSGFIFQIRNMPEWLQALTYLVPARYYIVVLRGIILKGAPLAPFAREVGLLALFAAATLALASLRLAREER